VVAASGSQAEALRQELESEGLEAMAKKRLRLCAARFTNARRVGPLEYRDDRAANEFFLAEIFEIKDFLVLDPKTKWYKLDVTNDYIANLLPLPDASPRRTPFALPHPCNIVHTIELHSMALAPAAVQQRSIGSGYLQFTRFRKTLAGFWTMKLTLSTLADAVPPESLDEHRETLQEIRAQSVWSLLLPPGDSRPHQRRDFGALPVSWEPTYLFPPPSPPRPLLGARPGRRPPPGNGAPKNTAALENGAATPAPAPAAKPSAPKLKRRKRNRRKNDEEPKPKWPVITLLCVLALTLIVIVVLVARHADYWKIFKMRPESPVPPANVNVLPGQ
jgi:hypothetical protein